MVVHAGEQRAGVERALYADDPADTIDGEAQGDLDRGEELGADHDDEGEAGRVAGVNDPERGRLHTPEPHVEHAGVPAVLDVEVPAPTDDVGVQGDADAARWVGGYGNR